jgi:hypothetical protein
MAARLNLLFIAALLGGCFDPGEGVAPPAERVYFPVGLALDTESRFLYVANSDFDLQYNAGTLQSFDLEELRARVPRGCVADDDCSSEEFCDLDPTSENLGLPSKTCVPSEGEFAGMPCGAFGERPAADRLLAPGRCGYIDPVAVQDGGPAIAVDSVEIGAFARELIYRRNPNGEGRLFATVAGDATLHWIDTVDGTLQCGQANNDGACDDRHRAGDDPERENTRDLRLLPEPFALDASVDGRAILVSNQTSGAVSLFMNDWSDAGPVLEFAVGDLPSRPVGVAHVGTSLLTLVDPEYSPGFLVTFRNSANVVLVKVYDDARSDPARPFARAVGSSSISINSVGTDSRGIVVDSSARTQAELACGTQFGVDAACLTDEACRAAVDPGFFDCLKQVTDVPFDVYVANRTPPSLLVGQTHPVTNDNGTDDLPAFNQSIPLTAGPSRVVLGSIINAQGELERRVFVVCFDSRRIFIYDPVRRTVEAEVTTGRGPHALAVDTRHGLAYVGHFTDSFIGVIALDQRFPDTYATLVATVARPTPPRASK